MRCECERRALSMKPDEQRSRIPTCALPAWPQAQQARTPARTRADQRLTPSIFCPSSTTSSRCGVWSFGRSKTGRAVKPRLGNSCRIRLPRLSQPTPTASTAKRPCECARQSFQQSRRFLTFLAGWSSSPSGAAPGAPPAERLQRKTRALRMLPAAIGPVVDHNKSVQLAG